MRTLILSAVVLISVSAADVAAGAATPEIAAGDWRLSVVGGRIACTLTLTRETGVGGYEVKAPLACREAFPPLKAVAAWALNDKGAIVLSDAQAHPIIVFPAAEGAPFEAKAPDGSTWRLDPVVEPRPSFLGGRLSGAYRLDAPGGAKLCDLTLTSNFFGSHGGIIGAACAPAWSDRGWATWSLRAGELSLMDKDGKPILVMKPGGRGVYVVADPKADQVTLARR
jgi:hypothetical protein